MTILNYKNRHFNLIIDRNHALFQVGSLKFQQEKSRCDEILVETIIKKKVTFNERPSEDTHNDSNVIDEHIHCCREEDTCLDRKCESELDELKKELDKFKNALSEEVAKRCKAEDMLKALQTAQEINITMHKPTEKSTPIHLENTQASSPCKLNCCEKCDFTCKSRGELELHVNKTHTKSNFICNECDFISAKELELSRHLKEVHGTGESENFSCISCAQQFGAKSSLIRHRLNALGKSKIKCRNRANGKCKWGAIDEEDCLYDHKESDHQKNVSQLECNSCDEKFTFKSQFLKHRKAQHPKTVPDCKTDKEGKKCPFGERCGFNHINTKLSNPVQVSTDDVICEDTGTNKGQITNQANFWEARHKTNPPDQMKEMKKMLEIMMIDIAQLKEQQSITRQN